MYEYWNARRHLRNGLGPTPTQMSNACGRSIYAARAAASRFRRGRVAFPRARGLAPKSVKNVHGLLHQALSDAVPWQYLTINPAVHASVPRVRGRGRNRPQPWTLDELEPWLRVALTDRFSGMGVLVATTGMWRSGAGRCEPRHAGPLGGNPHSGRHPGCRRRQAGRLRWQTQDSRRTISLDPFTVAALRSYIIMLDKERVAFGSSYPDHGKLMVFEDGRRLHPDTITRRFNRLVDRAGARRIRLHGHGNESVTPQI